MTMDLHVDRLALRVAGISEADGRRLARLIAAHLSAAELPGGARATDRLRVRLEARPGEGVDELARRIATDLLRALVRTS